MGAAEPLLPDRFEVLTGLLDGRPGAELLALIDSIERRVGSLGETSGRSIRAGLAEARELLAQLVDLHSSRRAAR